MGHRRLAIRNRRTVVGLLAVAAVGTALLAPLATSTGPAGAVTIDGARSLADTVEVRFEVASQGSTTDVHLLAWNDFHGNLEAGAGLNIYGQFAGGAAWLAKAVHDKQEQYGRQQISVIAGDNIGASPLVDGLFFGEPSTIVTNLMNADFAVSGQPRVRQGVGRAAAHPEGRLSSRRRLHGGALCVGWGDNTNRYPGADFQYLSANVVSDDNGRTLFPAYGVSRIKSDNGRKIDVGVIGAVLEATPTIVTPTGVAGLTFQDEADAANQAVAQLRRQGVDTTVLVIHQGGFQSGTATLNGCAGNLAGSDIAEIAIAARPRHQGHRVGPHPRRVPLHDHHTGRGHALITSASSFGRILTDITLTIDDRSGELMTASATNSIVRNSSNPRITAANVPLLDRPKDEQVADVVHQYVTAVGAARQPGHRQGQPGHHEHRQRARRDPIGRRHRRCPARRHAAGQPGRRPDRVHEPRRHPRRSHVWLPLHPVGRRGAGAGHLRRGVHRAAFGNSLVTKTMTGGRSTCSSNSSSSGVAARRRSASCRSRPASAGSATGRRRSAPTNSPTHARRISGRPTRHYATGVTMNNFLAAGGDGFTVFNQGTNALGGAQDIDALVAYFGLFLPGAVPNPPVNRISQCGTWVATSLVGVVGFGDRRHRCGDEPGVLLLLARTCPPPRPTCRGPLGRPSPRRAPSPPGRRRRSRRSSSGPRGSRRSAGATKPTRRTVAPLKLPPGALERTLVEFEQRHLMWPGLRVERGEHPATAPHCYRRPGAAE